MVVKRGSLVKFHYTGKFDDGKIFSSSRSKGPVECKVSEGRLVSGIEDGLIGMKVSEKKEIVVPPEKGYGQRDRGLVIKVDKNILRNSNVEIGGVIKVKDKRGKVLKAEVLAIETDTITLDFNHPLAGKTLKFDVEVIEIH